MTKSWIKRVSLIALVTVSFSLEAKRFTNQYTEFELPGGWECQLEGTEWVCQSSSKDRKQNFEDKKMTSRNIKII